MRELKLETKIQVYTQSELSDEEKSLLQAAKVAAESAYAPYSQFQVGASVLLYDGCNETISASNQENAAYPSGLCAERTALFYAHARYPHSTIKTLAIVARRSNGFTPHFVPPCGACRQVMKEYEELQKSPIRVLMGGEEEVYVVQSVADLLPLSFVLHSPAEE